MIWCYAGMVVYCYVGILAYWLQYCCSIDALMMHSWCQPIINNGKVMCDVVVQQCCIDSIAHQSGSIAAQTSTSQNTHPTERKKGMVLCEFYLKLKSCPLPFPLPLAKVENTTKTQNSKNCTEFALSADTENECQKKSSGCQLPGMWFSTVSILGAVLYQYWSNTGANNVTEVYQ